MFYLVIAAFSIGVSLATVFQVSWPIVAWLALLGLIGALLHSRSVSKQEIYPFLGVALFLFALSLGIIRTEIFEDQYGSSSLATMIGDETMLSGVVIREPDERERSTHLYVESGKDTLLVTVDRHTDIQYGDEVLVSGEIEKPSTFETELGRTFNYIGYLLARDVEYLIRYPTITVLREDSGNLIIADLLRYKEKLLLGIGSVIREPEAGLAAGLLLGVKQALGDSLETAFRQSGIIHIVVLSGYNVMLVVAFFRFFMKPLPRAWQVVLGLLAIAAFALLVGLSATVVRASIMAGLVLVAGYWSRQYDVLRALFFAGLVMLLINPYLLMYDIGFQLSFMATLGLLLIAPRLEIAMIDGQWLGVKEFFLATLATQIAVLPLLMFHIGEVSLVAVIVNILVLPIVPLAMLGAFLSGVAALVLPIIALPIATITSVLLSIIIYCATWFAGLPFATLTLPAFSAYWIPIMYLALVLTYFISKRWLEKKGSLQGWEIHEESRMPLKEISPITPSNKTEKDLPVFFK